MESKKRRMQRPKKAIYYLIPAWLLLFLCMSRSQVAESASSAPSVQVIAHRAGAALAPENTLAALENAIRVGADIAEIDVQMSKDGVLLAMHDKSLERTTGLCCSTWEVNWTVLQAADAGALYSADYAGERIPTLEALLNAARGQIPLMIEIKCTGHE